MTRRRTAEDMEEGRNQAVSIRYNSGCDVKISTDKLTNLFFSRSAPEPPGTDFMGRRKMIPLKYEGRRSKQQITLYYDYYFDDPYSAPCGEDRRFDDYDFFLMTALDNLFLEGNTVVSFTKIWREMGNRGNPNARQMAILSERLTKGMSATVIIDDLEVQKAWMAKTNKNNTLISPLFPIQVLADRLRANGEISDGMVKIQSLSPIFLTAQSINHYSSWRKEVLQLYTGKRTGRYYNILHYLISQVGWMRHSRSKRNSKITFQDLYEYTDGQTQRVQQLDREVLIRLLDEVFVPAGYVESYTRVQDGKPGVLLCVE